MPIHLFVVHFPVAFIVVGAIADVAGAVFRSEGTRRWAGTLLILGAVFALAAFLTGQAALSALGPAREGGPRIEAHTQWGAVGVWVLVVAGGLRAAWRQRLRGATGWVMLALAILSAMLVVGIATSGTAILHG
ncbi:MAG TPA: DUF2231 domain-containing protein [Longimicrobiaceae bacterium]|nr:DUF2231 domain-containing protein [Longimicrobiaceae bacterium]